MLNICPHKPIDINYCNLVQLNMKRNQVCSNFQNEFLDFMKHELRHFSTHPQTMLELKPRIIPIHALTSPNFLIISTDFFVLLITALFPQYKIYPFLFSSSSKAQNQQIVLINWFINLIDCFFSLCQIFSNFQKEFPDSMKHELRHFSTHPQTMLELNSKIIPIRALTRPRFLIISCDFFVFLITALFPQYKIYPFYSRPHL